MSAICKNTKYGKISVSIKKLDKLWLSQILKQYAIIKK
jgi:hypothetical protein